MTKIGTSSTTTRLLRKVKQRVIKSRAGRIFSTARAHIVGKSPLHILIVSDGGSYTSEQQFAPMIRHSAAIAAQTGVVFTFMPLDEARRLPAERFSGWYAVGLKMTFSTRATEAIALAHQILGAAKASGARTILFDGDDDLSVLWPEALDAADVCIKKHLYADAKTYIRTFAGKSNLTDYSQKNYGVSFINDIIPQSGALSPDQIEKLVLGWNIAQDDKMIDLRADIPLQATNGKRDIDILCRASVPPEVWTYGMRNEAVEAITGMAGRYRIHAPVDRVSQAEYYGEMLRARIVVSPYGFGEICWRDVEAILCGSLLVKPDMAHVKTWPDLFIPFETYLPVAWDYSDLEKVCAPYLANEDGRCKIAAAARESLLEALKPQAFVDRFEATMRSARIL